MKNYLLLFCIFLTCLSRQGAGYDSCSDKNIEFCLEDGKPPVFEYVPPKKMPQVVKKKAPEKEKKMILDTSTGFKKGEIVKEVETLGYGDSALYEKLSKEGFNPEQDYFVEDKGGKEVLLVGGEKIAVRRISQPGHDKSRLHPTGVMVSGGKTLVPALKPTEKVDPLVKGQASKTDMSALSDTKPVSITSVQDEKKAITNVESTVEEVETKRIFTIDKDGKVATKQIQIFTHKVKKMPEVVSASVSSDKNLWGNIRNRYQLFKTNVVIPNYEKAKTRIKNIFSRFLKRE